MGIPLKDVVARKEIQISDLAGKKIAIDAYNVLYQFLAAIRQRDGTPLKDSHGNITSHLAGLFNRTISLMESGIKPVFVFDGQPPDLKAETSEKRRAIKDSATQRHKEALEAGDLEAARRYGQQTSKLTSEIVKESKELICALGLPCVQAIGDGEAQAAYMARKGQVWAVASQDYDTLLFGAPRLVRNLTISGKKKMPGKKLYVPVSPEIIDLSETLNKYQIDVPSLVKVAILVGTDYNEGVKGLGPKTSIKAIKEGKWEKYASNLARAEQVQNIFLKPATTDNYNLKWQQYNPSAVREILVNRHDFSESRVNASLRRLDKPKSATKQSTLASF